MPKSEKLFGKAGFEKYYSELFGTRWDNLKAALLERHAPFSFFAGKKEYFLDAASVFAALSLPLFGAKNILDLCAAPGGKSLVLANRMQKDATLFCNERSQKRRVRLQKVLDEHLDCETRGRVKITCANGAVLCKKQDSFYDAILLDAPCSCERYVFSSSKHLEKWSPARIKALSVEQWALLSSAFRLLRPGGFLLYCTCALCKNENAFIIKKLIKKFPSNAKIEPADKMHLLQKNETKRLSLHFEKPKHFLCEKNEFGLSILPDKNCASGPIYFCLVQKI